jgi:hypothetical protein
LQCVLAARILTVDFVVCTLAVKKKSGQVSICRIGPFPCECIFSLFNIISISYKIHNYFITVNFQLFSNQSSKIHIRQAIISKKIYHFDILKKICNVHMFACHTIVLPATTSAVHHHPSHRYHYGGRQLNLRVRVILWLVVYCKSVHLGAKPLETHDQYFFLQPNTCDYSHYVTFSLMGGQVCHFQLLLGLTSAVILGSESHRTYDHILLSQIWDSSHLEGHVPIFTYPQTLGSLFVAFYDSQGYGGGIRPYLQMGILESVIVLHYIIYL